MYHFTTEFILSTFLQLILVLVGTQVNQATSKNDLRLWFPTFLLKPHCFFDSVYLCQSRTQEIVP